MTSRCATPLSDEVLLDYWLEEPPAAPPDVEEHLLGCGDCTGALARLVALGDGIRDAARAGDVRAVVSSAYLARVAREGLRLREYRVAPGGSVECSVDPDDDLLLARLETPAGVTARVDIVWVDAEGREQERLLDVPVHGGMREVVWVQRIGDVRALPKSTLRARLVAVDDAGERLLAEYTFNHTPAV